MFELWVPITVVAAFLQFARTALQKSLRAQLSVNGATFVRFFYGFPLAIVYLLALRFAAELELPAVSPLFFAYCLVAAVAQIVATSLLIHLFSLRNFAAGTTYSKTEAIQTALFGIVILGEPLTWGGFLAILVGVVGVMALSLVGARASMRNLLLAWTERAAVIGIAAGGLFAITAVAIRAAALSLGGEGFLIQAALTLMVVTVLQTALLGAYLGLREPAQLGRVLSTWRKSALVGIMGVVGSAGWFTAMTLQNAAYVRTLGQIELVFTFVATHYLFRERIHRAEVLGVALVVLSIVLLLNVR
jgi:drug/metabolite transporter (DMT)-like permease